jgi:hypothetical protein
VREGTAPAAQSSNQMAQFETFELGQGSHQIKVFLLLFLQKKKTLRP